MFASFPLRTRIVRFAFSRVLVAATVSVLAGGLVAPSAAVAGDAPMALSSVPGVKVKPRRARVPKPAVAVVPAPASRANAPVVTVSGTGPDQAGYIHYFVITGPDGEPISHIGIELAGGRIAWAFPEMGVVVAPFIASGTVSANGQPYDVQYLYGIRPFLDEASMRVLRRQLAARVASWTDAKTPYCDEQSIASGMCMSCLGFVLRVLYPGTGQLLPNLPADFTSARKNMYTTEDLLLYLTGVPVDGPSETRLKRIERITVPPAMREELVRIASEIDAAKAAQPTK